MVKEDLSATPMSQVSCHKIQISKLVCRGIRQHRGVGGRLGRCSSCPLQRRPSILRGLERDGRLPGGTPTPLWRVGGTELRVNPTEGATTPSQFVSQGAGGGTLLMGLGCFLDASRRLVRQTMSNLVRVRSSGIKEVKGAETHRVALRGAQDGEVLPDRAGGRVQRPPGDYGGPIGSGRGFENKLIALMARRILLSGGRCGDETSY